MLKLGKSSTESFISWKALSIPATCYNIAFVSGAPGLKGEFVALNPILNFYTFGFLREFSGKTIS